MKNERVINNIVGAYIAFFIIYSAAKRIVPFALLMQGVPGDMVYIAFSVVGIGLLLWTAFFHRTELKVFAWPVLLIFVVVTVISSLINIKYGFVKNVNIIICGIVHYFLFFAYYKRVGKDEFLKNLRLTFDAILIFWVIATIVSFAQFYKLTAYRVILDNVERRIGFFDNRLFGVFIDPNFAAIVSLILILAVVLNFKYRPKWMKVWYVFTVIVNYSYIILSGSRTVEISLYLVAFLGGFFALYYRMIKKNAFIKAFIISVLIGAVCMVALYPVGKLTKNIWEKVPAKQENSNVSPYIKELFEKEGIQGVSLDRTDVNEENISNNRFDIWKSYVAAMKGKYIFGLSPRNAMPYAAEHYPDSFMVVRNYSIHNGYLAVFAFTGVAGAITMLAFLVLLVRRVLAYMLTSKKVSKDYVVIVLMVVALASYSFFFTEMFLINNFTSSLIWPLFGCLAIGAKEE